MQKPQKLQLNLLLPFLQQQQEPPQPPLPPGNCRCYLVNRGPIPVLGRGAVLRLCQPSAASTGTPGLPQPLTAGRRPDAQLVLKHASASRQQFMLKPVADSYSSRAGWSWHVADLSSSNGTFVNGRRLVGTCEEAAAAHRLCCGDLVSIGPPREAAICLEFVVVECPLHGEGSTFSTYSSSSTVLGPATSANDPAMSSRKRSSAEVSTTNAAEGPTGGTAFGELANGPTVNKRANCESTEAQPPAQDPKLAAEVVAMRAELERLRDQLAEKDRALAEQEHQMRQKLRDEVEALEADRLAVMAGLEAEMRKEMEERDAEHEALLQRERARLEQALRDKEAKQAVLENELAKASEAKGQVTPEARADIVRSLAEVLETELNCPICCDMLVDSASLPCSHTFCRYCIEEWLRRKNECPQCRAPGNGTLSRALVVDSYVDRLVAELAPERKTEREQRVKEQREKLAKLQGRRKPKSRQEPPSSSSTSAGAAAAAASTSAATNSNNNRRNQQQERPAPRDRTALPPPTVANRRQRLHDESSDEDDDDQSLLFVSSDDDDDENSSVDGNPRAYYGGYGRCYSCGRRGHWANGCPYN